MCFRFTLFNSVTLFVMLLTIGMIYARFRFHLEATWPLLYYIAPIYYGLAFRDTLDARWVLGGVVCAVLLRFEFMGGFILKGVRTLEMIFFGYVLWRCWAPLMLGPW
jgi:hypothetical protein